MKALYLDVTASTIWPLATGDASVARAAGSRANYAARCNTRIDGQTASHGRPPFGLPSSWKENFRSGRTPLPLLLGGILVVSFSEVGLTPWTNQPATRRSNCRS